MDIQSAKQSGGPDVDYVLDMFARAAFIRSFEAKAWELSRGSTRKIDGSVHLCAGQEVVPLGAIAALRADDQVIATYRGHGWALASGLDPFSVFSEICHRATGINQGRAGSAYIQAPDTRFIGENSIVGAGTTIACGVALANLCSANGRVVIVSIGDGAMNQGAVHEAMAFAAVRQLPIIFVCENNGWSELTATQDMFRVDRLARRATGYGFRGATIDGTDPIAVRNAVAGTAEIARSGGGPALIECLVPRLWGHYNGDIEHYRPKADRLSAESRDPLTRMRDYLTGAGAISVQAINQIQAEQEAKMAAIAEAAQSAPTPDAATVEQHVIAGATDQPKPVVIETRELTYADAVNAALRTELAEDQRTIFFGEDVGKSGGIFGVAKRLQADFGESRVFDMPIAENAIIGTAIGAALSGMRPIAEIMWGDFLFVAFDQLINQASNVRYVTGGRCSLPLVVRVQQGVTPGSCAQHSQSIEAIIAHVPGLKVALAATPDDAYALLRAAVHDPDPCIIIEARGLYQTKGTVNITKGVEPVGRARLHRQGEDALIVTWGAMLQKALVAADLLQQQDLDVSVLDLRWLNPLDEAALEAAIRSSGGRVLIVHEAVRTGGFAAEIAMRIQEKSIDALRMPVRRLTTPDIRIPASRVLQNAAVPDAEKIVRAVKAMF